MPLETIYCRTRMGALALADPHAALSPGFRRFLKLVNGVRNGKEILAEMQQLDAEDFALWIDELTNSGLIALPGKVAVDDMAFELTTDLAPHAPSAASPHAAMVEGIVDDVTRAAGAKVPPEVEQRLQLTGRMAAIESVSTFDKVGSAGFFVYPDAAADLPPDPRVCVAGHDAAQNRLLALVLKRLGVVPTVCATRQELQPVLAGAAPPHVLLVDGQMPRLNGFRLLELIRTKASLKDMHTVVLSELGNRAYLARALMLGASGYIVKPLRRQVLEGALPIIMGRPLH